MRNLHRSKIRFNSSWQWVRDKRCGEYLENATVMPSRAFDTFDLGLVSSGLSLDLNIMISSLGLYLGLTANLALVSQLIARNLINKT